jgi:hypothetical protein
MKNTLAFLLAAALPAAAGAQQDVNRRTFTFLENHLEVAVLADAPGVLQVVRGELGQLEVAGRASEGFAGYGLGGHLTRQLRLTAVGAEAAEYLVVVPEHVNVRVHLPDGTSADLPPRAPAATYRWAAAAPTARYGWIGDRYDPGPYRPSLDVPELTSREPQLRRTVAGGLFVVHQAQWAPAVVDVPSLSAIRSLDLRFEGSDFRVATSRPLTLQPGDAAHFIMQADGEPLDVLLFVPHGTGRFLLRAGGIAVAEVVAGRPRALCGSVIMQQPSAVQTWLSFRPDAGRLDCR